MEDVKRKLPHWVIPFLTVLFKEWRLYDVEGISIPDSVKDKTSAYRNENDIIETKYVLCNNCDALHEVQDICKSEIKWGKDAYIGLVNSKDDIKFNLSSLGKDNIVTILEKNDCDISVWEFVEHVIENNLEENIVLDKKEIDKSCS